MKSTLHPRQLSTQRQRKLNAFSLVEVMVSTVIFAMMALSLTGLFMQNMRFAKVQTYSVQLVNSTFGVLDQLKNTGSSQIWEAFKAPKTTSLTVNYVDPTDTTDGYRTLPLKINKVATRLDGTTQEEEIDASWTSVNLRFGTDTNSPSLPVQYWLSLTRNKTTANGATTCDVIEATLVYQWKIAGNPTKYVGQLQLTFPAKNGTFE